MCESLRQIVMERVSQHTRKRLLRSYLIKDGDSTVICNGEHIKGSPLGWTVVAGGPWVNSCRLLLPAGYSPERPLQVRASRIISSFRGLR